MKKQMLALVAATASLSAFAADPSPAPSASAAPSAQTSSKAVNTVCPVSGDTVGDVGKPVYAQYQGKTIAFCCKDCLKKFNKNPDKYGSLALKNQSANEEME
ncbi:MAG TPA: YHS domain-containing protein [Chthoniobacterales bacterium]|nr:YHS domain-containing protein [Chthoniobacterales bacterium]